MPAAAGRTCGGGDADGDSGGEADGEAVGFCAGQCGGGGNGAQGRGQEQRKGAGLACLLFGPAKGASGSSGAGDVAAADAKSDGQKNPSMWPKEGS